MGFSEHMTALAGEPSILYAKKEGRLRHFETRYSLARFVRHRPQMKRAGGLLTTGPNPESRIPNRYTVGLCTSSATSCFFFAPPSP